MFLRDMKNESRFGFTSAGVMLIVLAFGLPPESAALGDAMIILGVIVLVLTAPGRSQPRRPVERDVS